MGDRRLAREVALQILFQKDFNEGSPAPHALIKTDTNTDFSKRLVEGVLQYRADIDETIQKKAEHWTIERMASVDLNVLRIAVFEMVYEKETPAKVIIDEAIEIAKKYGNENSGAFVNGILDAVATATFGITAPQRPGLLVGAVEENGDID
jgi:N utilization substance protein B